MLLLTGEFDLTLDEKNRLFLPGRVREQIPAEAGSGFYLVLGPNRILGLYPDLYYQRLALAVAPRRVAPDDALAFDRVNYSQAGKVELDRQGRVLLNERAIRRAGLKERVTLIGVRDHLEVWDQEQWQEYLEAHLAEHEALLLQARQEALQEIGQRELGRGGDPESADK